MLDRKTKDRDASIELLEDREKHYKITMEVAFIVGIVTILFSLFFYLIELKLTAILLSIYGLAEIFLGVACIFIRTDYDLRIYIKRKLEG